MKQFDLGAVTAYAIAVKNGFEGTETEWLESLKGKNGDPGGGSGVDVTAQPGQMIIVKSVDENGKPTEWEAVDRTHWAEGGMVEVLAETPIVIAEGQTEPSLQLSYSLGLVPGESYVCTHDGTAFKCVAQDMSATFDAACVCLGDMSAYGGSGNGEPFIVMDMADNSFSQVVTSEECTFSIYRNAEVVHKLDGKYLPDGVPYVEQGGMVEILPMTELTLNVDSFSIYSKIEGVDVGKSYVVNYNGTAYNCVGQDVAMMPGAVVLGDMGMMDGEPVTGEPFIFMILPSEMFEQMGVGGQVIAIDGAETLSISLSAVDETLHKVDPRLLPDDLVKDILIVNVATLDGDFYPATASHTGSDLKNACLFGKKAALFAYDGKTLPLITVGDTEVTAEFGNIYFSNGAILRDYVVIDVDGNITTYEIGKTVSL